MQRSALVLVHGILLGSLFTGLQAQTDLPSGKVEVVKSFDARLEDTDKISIPAQGVKIDTSAKRYTYEVIPSEASKIKLSYQAPEIRPLAMPNEAMPPYYKGFAKAGIGFPISPYGELGYGTSVTDNLWIMGQFRHHSANDSRRENQRFMDNDLLLRGQYYFDQGFVVGARVNYSLDDYYFYGYEDQDTSFQPQYVRRRFNTLDAGFSLANAEATSSNLNYWANFDFYSHKDNLEAREGGSLIRLGLKKFLGGKHPVFAEIISDISNYQDTGQYKLNNFFFAPGAAFQGDIFSVHGAVRIASHNDEFFFLPDLRASLRLADGAFNVTVGWDGNLYKNSFRNLTTYNPFLRPILPELRNAVYQDIYASISGIAGNWNYEIKGGYKPTTDMALFTPDYTDIPTRFQVLYDTVSIIYAKANLQTTIAEQLTLGLSAGYNIFDAKTELEAWHIPSIETNLSATYRSLDQKLRVRGEVFFTGGVPYLTQNQEVERLNALFDVSVAVDYFFTEKFGAFVHLNNLAGNRWRRWYNYPTYGINALGGIMFRF